MNHYRAAPSPRCTSALDRAIVQVSRKLKQTKDETRSWLQVHITTPSEPSVHEVSALSLVNGLLRGARSPDFGAMARLYLESLAGRILAPSLDSTESTIRERWDEQHLLARVLSDEAVASYRE
ncbi:MAG: hypothetical protein ACK4XJ_11390 [Fimbriimonadaceae bacterium]